MPQGPAGFPRLTDIGPFSDIEATQEFQREEEVDRASKLFLDREISSIHGVDLSSVTAVESRLVVREEVGDADSIIGEIQRAVDVATRDNEVARMKYWYDSSEGISRIIKVFVEEDFRNMGIATRLKRMELDHMKSNEIDLSYTDVVSEGGLRLAERTGFRPIWEADHLVDTEAALSFTDGRGIMFKYL